MARKPKEPAAEEMSPERKGYKAILEEARENFKLDLDADRENRDRYKTCMEFCFEPGKQWEDSVKLARGKKRITREFNETRVKVKSVVNHIRANRPAAKISPVEEGDIDTAEAMNGIWLNIWNTSDADNVTDFAAETQVAAGMGAWFVDTDYCEDSVSDQDIFIRPIRNPLCLVPDRAAKEQDKSDARHWNYYTNLSKTAFESKYGKAEKVASFQSEELQTDNDPNTDDDSVWLTAYWRKEPYMRTLALLSTGETVDKADIDQTAVIVKERTAKAYKIVQYICSADSILERNEWAGKYFPFVVAYGEYVVIDGKTRWSGLTETMMDAQRAHNETLSGVFEAIALAPQAKYWATAKQGAGLMGQWNTAVEENIQTMLYNHDPAAPGPPVRVGGADVPAALMQASQMSRDSMKSVSGIFDASLGEVSNETSGRAIRARQDQALIVTYNFSDNIAKAIGRTCKIVLDLIPKIIDTERGYRILGKEGAEKYVTVNKRDPLTGEIIENDLSKGKYDFVVTEGPNIQTQRQEATEFYQAMSQSNPMLQQVAGDVIFDNADVPGAKQVAERLKAVLPPQIQALLNKDKPEDPRVIAAMQALQQQEAAMQEQAALVEQAGTEAQTEKAAAEKAKADVQIALANLKTEQANLATQQAQFQTLVANTQAKFAGDDAADIERKSTERVEASDATVAEKESALAEVGPDVEALKEQVAMLTQQLMQVQQAPVIVAPRPRILRVVKQNGAMVPIYEDQVVN
jgi:Phage P22-like portal protein